MQVSRKLISVEQHRPSLAIPWHNTKLLSSLPAQDGDAVGSEVVGAVVGSELVGETDGDVVGDVDGDTVGSEVVGAVVGSW